MTQDSGFEKDMPLFAWFFGIKPWEYDRLTLEQYAALKTFVVDFHKARSKT